MEELDPEVVHGCFPEPLDVFLGAADELRVGGDAVRAHQSRHVGPLRVFERRRPREVVHEEQWYRRAGRRASCFARHPHATPTLAMSPLRSLKMTEWRGEKDSMGEGRRPQDAYWGAQTQRAVENFPVSGMRMP